MRERAGKPNTISRGIDTAFRTEYIRLARAMCKFGATDADLAEEFGVCLKTIHNWAVRFPEFGKALRIHKGEYDDRVERSLATRAIGFYHEAVKIFMPAGATEPVYAKYMEYVPPDVNACKYWLNNRKRKQWRNQVDVGDDDTVIQVKMVI